METFLLTFLIIIGVGVPLIAGLCTLGFLFSCVNDLLARHRADRRGEDAAGISLHLKQTARKLLISAILFACGWALLSVLAGMILGNM